MFKKIVTIVSTVVFIAGAAVGSSIELNKELKPFSSILINCPGKFIIVNDGKTSVDVNAPGGNEYLDITVVDGVLNIIAKKSSFYAADSTYALIHVDKLKNLDVQGTARVTLQCAGENEDLKIAGEGLSLITLTSLRSSKLNINLADNSCLLLKGRSVCGNVLLKVGDSGHIVGENLYADNVSVIQSSRKSIDMKLIAAKNCFNAKIESFGCMKLSYLTGNDIKIECDRHGDFRAVYSAKSFADSVDLVIRGCGNIFFYSVKTQKLSALIDSTGDMTVSGTTRKQKVEINGSGTYFGQKMKCDDISLKSLGTGNSFVYATDNANIRQRGCGDIYIRGRPVKMVDRRGSIGEIKRIYE